MGLPIQTNGQEIPGFKDPVSSMLYAQKPTYHQTFSCQTETS
jgi:hypothetical protein